MEEFGSVNKGVSSGLTFPSEAQPTLSLCAHLALPEVAQWEKLRVNGASFVNSLQGYWAEFIF